MVFVVMVAVVQVGMIVVMPDVMVEFVVELEVVVKDRRAKLLVAGLDNRGERLGCGNLRSNEVQSLMVGRVRVVGSPLLSTVVGWYRRMWNGGFFDELLF